MKEGERSDGVRPVHVAIILDGNGRWARMRGLSRSEGHRAGGEALDRMLESILELEIPYISLYAFSTENWRRPKIEINAIWSLLKEFFEKRLQRCLENGIKIVASGDLEGIPGPSRKIVKEAIKATQNGQALTANFCINYGSQDEILHACHSLLLQRIALFESGSKNEAKKKVEKAEFEKYLYTYPLPEIDLLVRPGGEFRISNFLLWQCAYAEFFFTQTFWPDFDRQDLMAALDWYAGRERRYGGLFEGNAK